MAPSLNFFNAHRPALTAGAYRVDVTLSLLDAARPSKIIDFEVAGPRFTIDPADIHSMFPPPASLGDHAHVLPHVILRRSTLPWERSADNGQRPWLALLLFDEAETVGSSRPVLGDVRSALGITALDTGQTDADAVNVIQVDAEVLKRTMPTGAELDMLTHVRHGVEDDVELSVVVGCRLPASKRSCTAHLVSVENRFAPGGDFIYPATGRVTLISLASWRFTCSAHEHSFTGQLRHLNGFDKVRPVPLPANGLSLPIPAGTDARIGMYYEAGYVPLRHRTRNGQKTVSWYHSPLAGGPKGLDRSNPIEHADEALIDDKGSGMYDTSYSAAWELGRLLMLNDKHASAQLYLWKRRIAHASYRSEPEPAPPAELIERFARLGRLEGVPFHYLVPDARLLPLESMRFFQVDLGWVDRLVQGAFRIGHVTDKEHHAAGLERIPRPTKPLSGFIMRSAFVSDWPLAMIEAGIKTEAGAVIEPQAAPVRRDVIAPGILLCLFEFEGVLSELRVHQKPEALHYGFLPGDENSLSKKPRTAIVPAFDIPWKDAGTRRLDVMEAARLCHGAAALPATFTSAEFSYEMMEGVEQVRFIPST